MGRTSHLDFFLRGACGNASVNVHNYHHHHHNGGNDGGEVVVVATTGFSKAGGGRYGKRRSTLASVGHAEEKCLIFVARGRIH